MSRASLLALSAAAAALVLSGVAAAAGPVSGSIAGPVTSVKGNTFTLRSSLSPTGTSTVHVTSSTTITEQETAGRSDLKAGGCAVAVGQKAGNGSITAVRVTLSAPVQGKCQNGFFGQRGEPPPNRARAPGGGYRPPGGSKRRPPQAFGNFAFASGAITAVDGSTVKLHSSQRSDSAFTVSAKTQIVRTAQVGASAIEVKLCAFVRGSSSDKGVTVSAQDVSLTQPGRNGCNGGFRRP